MKSFLREIEDKFVELENHCDDCDQPQDQCKCDEEIDEQNVTGAIAGYNTPNAFRKKVKHVGYASGIEESVNKSPSYSWKDESSQRPESDEEIFNDKFPFALDEKFWWQNDNNEYPTKFYADGMGTNSIKDKTTRTGNLPQSNKTTQVSKHTLRVEDVMERKYEQLIEGYRDFVTGDKKTSPEQKVKKTIQEIAKKLHEIETMVNYNTRLKTEAGVTSSAYGPSTTKALQKISEKLIKISERVRSLGE
jgi:hypothetical protein